MPVYKLMEKSSVFNTGTTFVLQVLLTTLTAYTYMGSKWSPYIKNMNFVLFIYFI
ncbi:hypothetical protein SB6413_05643 [Klebsiella pasteurii]|nr:hypothetical protein SB6413_05643 [Klebsiella pasteurii]